VGAEFGSKIIDIDETTRIKLQIWDTAGQESFQSLIKSFYRDAAGIFLVYNVNRKDTFESLTNWMLDIKESAPEDVILVLIGNQVDTPEMREVSYDEGLELMKQENLHFFFETSALDGTNIDLAFLESSKLAFLNEIQDKLENTTKPRNTIRLSMVAKKQDLRKPNCEC